MSRKHWYIVAFALPLIYLVVAVYINRDIYLHSCEMGADYKLIGLDVEKAKRFEALTGVYSRFGFRHPGPGYAYYYALMEQLLPEALTKHGRHLLGQLLLNFGCILATIWLVLKYFRKPQCAWMLFALLVLTFGKSLADGDIWNPKALHFPFLLMLTSAAVVARGRLMALPLMTTSATLVAHAHAGTLALVAAVTAVALVSMLLHLRKVSVWPSGWMAPLATAILIPLLLNIPVLADLFLPFGGGNLIRLFEFSSGSEYTHSFGKVFKAIAPYYDNPLRPWVELPRRFVLITLILLPLLGWVRGGATFRRLYVFSLLTIAVSLWTATRMSGELHGHLLSYHFVIAALLYFLSASALWLYLPSPKRIWNPLSLLSCVALLFLAPYEFNQGRLRCKYLGLNKRFIKVLSPQAGTRYQLQIGSPNAWPFVSGLALDLMRQEVDVCIDRGWWFLFDSPRTCEWRQHYHGAASRQMLVTFRSMKRSAQYSEPGAMQFGYTRMEYRELSSSDMAGEKQ